MLAPAEGVTWGNTAWNVLRFVSNMSTSIGRLADDFRLDVGNSNKLAIERHAFTSSVHVGLESLYAGKFPPDDEFDDDDELWGEDED